MIFDNYQDLLENARDYAQNLVPVDLGFDFGSRWALVALTDGQNGHSASFRQVFKFQTIISLDFVDESNVVTSIIENGSFVSYNKVPLPAQIVMTVALDGMESEQQTTLDAIRTAKNSTDIFSVVTPFETYDNMNITGLRYSRTAEKGATRTFLDITLQEIRQVHVQTSSMGSAKQVKNAGSVRAENIGKVNAKTPSVDTAKVLRENVGTVSDRLGGFISDA